MPGRVALFALTITVGWIGSVAADGGTGTGFMPAESLIVRQAIESLAGKAVYTGLGGRITDVPYQGDDQNEKRHKKKIQHERTTLPNSNAPSGGSHEATGSHRNVYTVLQDPGAIALTRDGQDIVAFAPLPQHVFFTVYALQQPDGDKLLVFGADTTAPANPVGILTVFNADTTHLYARQDLPLTSTRYPSSVDYDPATLVRARHAPRGQRDHDLAGHERRFDARHSVPRPFANPGFPGLGTAKSVALAVHPTLGAGVIVTPEIAHFVRTGASAGAVEWLLPPMLLNHVVLSILLLPLGGLTFYAAPHAARGERWARVVSRVTATAVAAFPGTQFVLMGARYFGAPAFVLATTILCVACLALLAVAFWPTGKSSA